MIHPYNNHRNEYTVTNTLELVHNNFGWGENLRGLSDKTGWYLKGLFDLNNGSDENSNTFRSDESNNYRHNNQLIVNIR